MHQTLTNPELLTATADTPAHVSGDHPAVLRHIVNPGVNLCLWQRPALPAVTGELSSLNASHLPDVRCWTSSASFDADVSRLLQQQGLDPFALKNWRTDLWRLADPFFSMSEGRVVALRMVTTDGNGCRRFHVDRTRLRLLCTYRGPGTEWLTDAQVDRAAQRSGASNVRIIRFGEQVRFQPFWVGILKGDAYPGNAGRGLVHRSPPIAGSGQTRVLFCLDW